MKKIPKTPQEKLAILIERYGGATPSELSRRHGISRQRVDSWHELLVMRADLVFQHGQTHRANRRKLRRAQQLEDDVEKLTERWKEAEDRCASIEPRGATDA